MRIAQTRQRTTEALIEGIEVSVGYELSEPQIEECHGFHDVGGLISLNYVKIQFGKGLAVDMLPLLDSKSQDYIIKQIND